MSEAANQLPPGPSVWLLGFVSGISPFGISVTVPVLAGIAAQFRADMGQVQFVISVYLLGLALAQPFNGFLCDRFGRRTVMLAGFAVFVLASLGAAVVNSLEALVALRFIQACGVSVGTVASRAVISDTRGARGSAEALSYIAAITGFAPICAPILGGWLGALGGYPSVFLCTAALGAGSWVLMYFRLPETLDRSRARPGARDWFRSYSVLLKSRLFLGYSLMFGLVQGSFFSFLPVGAAVFEQDFGMGAPVFGMVWGLLALAYVLGAVMGGRLTRRFDSTPVMRIAIFINLLTGWGLLLLTLAVGISLPGLLLPFGVLMAAAGGISPGALAGAVNAHPEMAGTSSGLSSAIGILVGCVFTVLTGYLYEGDFISVACMFAVASTLTSISWVVVRRIRT
jgi:DHA1 family bicyclomycin/chloramphenicol resistance-like MFS transporter